VSDAQRIGEVTQASAVDFTAECYELYCFPPLGGLVKTGDIFAVVYGASTASIEPGRRPIARGREQTDEEDIYRSSPQLMKLLRSEFNAIMVGYRGDKIYQYLPPAPARIHGFVYLCSPEEIREFSRSFDFLNILVKAHVPVSVEELTAACLRQMGQVYGDGRHSFLVAAGKELASLLCGDFNQLKAILERLE